MFHIKIMKETGGARMDKGEGVYPILYPTPPPFRYSYDIILVNGISLHPT